MGPERRDFYANPANSREAKLKPQREVPPPTVSGNFKGPSGHTALVW
jgi:hypothetical protein